MEREFATSSMANKQNIDRYNQIIKNDQDYVKQLSSSKNVGSLQGQTLLVSYIERIGSYQNKVYSLEDSQRDLKLTLESLQPKVVLVSNLKDSKLSIYSRINNNWCDIIGDFRFSSSFLEGYIL